MSISLESLAERFKSVPLGMSAFQIQALVVPKATDARSYRQALLELHKRYNALKKAEFRRRRMELEQNILKDKIAREEDMNTKAILEVDLEEKVYDAKMEDILINDAMIEVQALLNSLASVPEFTREQFEAGEEGHWRKTLLLEARRDMVASGRVSSGTLEELEKLGMAPEQVAIDVKGSVEKNCIAIEGEKKALSASSPATA